MSGAEELNFKDAKTAFNTFFNTGTSQVPPVSNDDNPAKKVLDQLSAEKKPPNKRTVTKVDTQNTSKSAVTSMSVDDAQAIVESKKDFKEILKEFKINYSELFAIIDSFLEKGYYEEKFKIKTLEFAYRTKKVHSIGAINDALDGSTYTFAESAGQMLLERSMAASLVYFKLGTHPSYIFEHSTDEDDEKSLVFVKNLSSPIYILMVNKLRRFELLTGLATRDEAIEHFLAHTQG